MLPAIEQFELFLANTHLVETPPSDAPSVPFATADIELSQARVLHLTYPESEVGLESMLKRIEDELDKRGHLADRDVALAVLGLIAESRDASVSAVDYANDVLHRTRSADFYLSIVLPIPAGPHDNVSLGTFSLKAFDPTSLLYWAERSGCGYPIDLERWAGRVAFEQERTQTTVIAWDEVPGFLDMVSRWGLELSTQSIADFYFHAVANHLARQAPPIIDEHLLVLEAGALVAFDARRLLDWPLSQQVNLFHWEGSRGHAGWALLSHVGMVNMNLVPGELFSTCEEWLREEFGFLRLSTAKPLYPVLTSYSRFLVRAHRHSRDGRHDEAFLHFVIALDLLLGMEGSAQEKVANRAALLVHRQLGETLATQRARIKKLYDKRSKYVHEGEQPPEEGLAEIECVCTEILWTLLAASANGEHRSVDAWLKQIDYLLSAIGADKVLTDHDYASVGIPFDGRRRTPPNKVIR